LKGEWARAQHDTPTDSQKSFCSRTPISTLEYTGEFQCTKTLLYNGQVSFKQQCSYVFTTHRFFSSSS
jgi:hypothetical protein